MFFGLFAVVSVIVIWAATPIWEEISNLTDDLPGYIQDLEDEPVFNQLDENTDVANKAKELARERRQEASGGGHGPARNHGFSRRIGAEHRDDGVPDPVPADRTARPA